MEKDNHVFEWRYFFYVLQTAFMNVLEWFPNTLVSASFIVLFLHVKSPLMTLLKFTLLILVHLIVFLKLKNHIPNSRVLKRVIITVSLDLLFSIGLFFFTSSLVTPLVIFYLLALFCFSKAYLYTMLLKRMDKTFQENVDEGNRVVALIKKNQAIIKKEAKIKKQNERREKRLKKKNKNKF